MEAGKVDSGQMYSIPPTPRDHPLPCWSLPSSLVEGGALWCLRNTSMKTSWSTGKPALISAAHSSALLYVVWSEVLVSQSCPNSLTPHGLQPARLLCPWNSPGKNTEAGSHFLLQGIFLTQELNLGLLHCRQILYHLSHMGKPMVFITSCQYYQYF